MPGDALKRTFFLVQKVLGECTPKTSSCDNLFWSAEPGLFITSPDQPPPKPGQEGPAAVADD